MTERDHKVCTGCGAVKLLSEFHRNRDTKDGHAEKCKTCRCAVQRAYAKANYAKASEATRRWREENKTKVYAYSRKYATVNRTVLSARAKLHYQNKKAQHNGLTRAWRNANPEKVLAHRKVSEAVRAGVLRRLPCERCGRKKTSAHHDDYSLPLRVSWLCQACHQLFHAERRREA